MPLFTRTRYQYGSLRLKKRRTGPDAWEFRYYDHQSDGRSTRKHVTIGTKAKYPTESDARRRVQSLLLTLNAETPRAELEVPSFGALIDKFVDEELPARYSTAAAYRSIITNYLRPRWSDYPLDRFKPMAIEQWFRDLQLAPKTKGNIRSLMHLIFTCAQRWCLIEMGKNPISLVRVKDCTKRLKRPRILTVEQFCLLTPHLKDPFRTMVMVAQCLGLRVSEIMALKWDDFDFDEFALLVQRSVVHGRVDEVKTEYSHDRVPLDEGLAEVLMEWKAKITLQNADGWVFPNPATGNPYHQEEILKNHIKPAAIAAGIGPDIGWHTFRHTYRSLLDETGAPMKVQQELMRHASIETTMNVYGQAMPASKRLANSRVVQMVLKPAEPKQKAAEKAASR